MKAKEYEVLVLALEEGIPTGLRRAWKYDSTGEPSEERYKSIAEVVIAAALNSICEWFEFERGEET